MSTNQGKVTQGVRNDFQDTRSERWSGQRKRERRQRVEDHRNSVDHGKGCVHCDVTHGRGR